MRLLTRYAVEAVEQVFWVGFNYSKAEVLLLGLCQPGEYTHDLFAVSQLAETTRMMSVLDQLMGAGGKARCVRLACRIIQFGGCRGR